MTGLTRSPRGVGTVVKECQKEEKRPLLTVLDSLIKDYEPLSTVLSERGEKASQGPGPPFNPGRREELKEAKGPFPA